MPPGAKKRKAAKKRMQKGGTRSNHGHTTNSNGASTAAGSHPHHENDDLKSFEERRSDPAEVEEEEEVNGDGEVMEDTKEVGLQEETVVETIVEDMESAAETIVGEIKAEVSSITDVKDDDSEINESLVKDLALDNGISNLVEVGVGEEGVVAEEKRESRGFNEDSDGAAEYLPVEAVGLPPGASNKKVSDLIEDDESGKQVTNSTTESTPAVIADVVESELEEDRVGVPPEVQYVKDESSAIKQSENKLVAPVVGVVDVVSEELSDLKVDAPPADPNPEAEVAIVTSREVDDSKNLRVWDNLERQPLISSTQPAIRRTSWKNCCGVFEFFVGADE